MKVVTHKEAYANFEGTEWAAKHETPDYPEGFRERLVGKSIEEQSRLFAVLENTTIQKSSYGEVDSERAYRYARRIDSISEFHAVIVDEDGLIEGIVVKAWPNRLVPMGPYDEICTYYACDDDGAGRNDREDNVTLICLPPDKEWE